MSVKRYETQFPIETFFPKLRYKEVCQTEKNAIPHFLIALSQNWTTIKAELDKRDPSYQEKRFGLTPIAVAVLVRNPTALKYLLQEKKVSQDVKDKGGLTPLQYAAALRDSQSLQLLQEASKASCILQDIFLLFPGWKEIFEPKAPQPQETVCYSLDRTPISAAHFEKLTCAQYCNNMFVEDPQAFVLMLASRLEMSLAGFHQVMSDYFIAQLEKRRAPRLLLGPQEAVEGMYAGEALQPLQILGIYGGKLEKEKPEDETYLLDLVNGKERRSLMPMLNDGFPNCACYEAHFPDGRVYQVVATLCAIAENKPLLWNYGANHSIKSRQRKELNIKDLENFFKDNPLPYLVKRMQEIETILSQKNVSEADLPLIIERDAITTRLSYLIQTPTAVIPLVIHEIISLEEVISIFFEEDQSDWLTQNKMVKYNLLHIFTTYAAIIKDFTSDEKNTFDQALLPCVYTYSVQALYVFFVYCSNTRSANSSLIEPICAGVDTLLDLGYEYKTRTIPREILAQHKQKIDKLPKPLLELTLESIALKFPCMHDLSSLLNKDRRAR